MEAPTNRKFLTYFAKRLKQKIKQEIHWKMQM